MTDIVAPFVPPARRGGRKREVNVREVINAIFYVLSTGCQWNALSNVSTNETNPG
jgi:transposase